jgi:hypothetical protein
MIMKKSISRVLACASLLALAGTARAGVLDSPLPTLGGVKTTLAFAASGVVNAAGLATLFSCTNTSSSTISVSVELFVDAGGNACNSADDVDVALDAGQSVMFSTQNNVQSSFFDTQPLTAVDMFLALGSARIVTTGKGLICTAMVADVYNSPPQSMSQIVLARGGKQK